MVCLFLFYFLSRPSKSFQPLWRSRQLTFRSKVGGHLTKMVRHCLACHRPRIFGPASRFRRRSWCGCLIIPGGPYGVFNDSWASCGSWAFSPWSTNVGWAGHCRRWTQPLRCHLGQWRTQHEIAIILCWIKCFRWWVWFSRKLRAAARVSHRLVHVHIHANKDLLLDTVG